ncbi:MAG: cell division FtsA domain-containing protein [Candidatus Sericytochromatia bacterium]|nr:cell division FtsA domain-containing protein [Candidatus Sericytochromatia bacterium]
MSASGSPSGPVFALDIGTRNVIGIVAQPDGDRLTILDITHEEHEERAMRDGQIHDIPKVVRAVRAVRQRLEQQTGKRLTQVAIAAAGRALKTHRARAKQEVGLDLMIDKERLRALELAAIQAAVGSLRSDETHCVGYSIVHYYLDGQPIGNLEGQRGKEIEVELIATFLPRVVTDSLVAVCHQAGLEVTNLTLEPIAAINAAVPSNMRALNLALIDIGAGTSDIALTQGGTVTAYAMVPAAGDSLTEAIAEAYLLDFLEAERVKHALSQDEAVTFTDVLGLSHTFSAEAIRQSVRPALDDLVNQVAEQIVALNGKPPAAAILIGGGALFPGVAPLMALGLGVPENRVAVRGTEMVRRIADCPVLLQGPMGVTPVGIALAALESPGFRFLTVYLDGKVVSLEDWGSTKVQDALLAAGYDLQALMPRKAEIIHVTLNGERRPFPGSPGGYTRILLNGQPTTPDTELTDGAAIEVVRPRPGDENQPLRVSDIVDMEPVRVQINGLHLDFPPLVKVNGQSIMGDRHLNDGDTVTVDRTVRALMVQAGLVETPDSVLHYYLDGEASEFTLRRIKVLIDQDVAGIDSEIRGGEVVEVTQQLYPHPTVADILPAGADCLNVRFNDRAVRVPNPNFRVLQGGEPVDMDAPLEEGAQLRRDIGGRMVVADLLPLLQRELDGDEGDEWLITVDGKFADMATAVTATSLIEILTEDPGVGEESGASRPQPGAIFP